MSYNIDLISQLRDMNKNFLNRLNEQRKMDRIYIRDILTKYIGNFSNNYSTYPFRKVFAVDGTFNSFGDNYPFIIHLLKAGSFGSGNKGYDKSLLLYGTKDDIQKELVIIKNKNNLDSEDMVFDLLKKKEMAKLEIQIAIETIHNEKPDLIMFDGGLMRYKNLCTQEFKEYYELTKTHNVVTVGVIEDIGTFLIAKTLNEKLDENIPFQYDREILYGLLALNESLIIKNDLKFKEGIQTTFARFSNDPNPIGIDIFEHDSQYLIEILSLVKNTTNINSRGIPFIIDKVDEHIKLKTDMTQKLIKNYIDQDILELYFTAKRQKR